MNIFFKTLPFLMIAFMVSCSQKDDDTTEKGREGEYNFKTFPANELKADLRQLFNTLDSVHYNLYHAHSRKEFDSVYHSIEQKLNRPMNGIEFYLALLPMFNLLQDAHSILVFPLDYTKDYTAQGGKCIPLKLACVRRKLYIIEDYSGKGIPPYSEVRSINDKPATAIIKDLHMLYNPENKSAEDDFISFFLPRMLFPLYGFDKEYRLEIITPGFKNRKYNLQGVSYEVYPVQQEHYFRFYKLDEKTAVLDLNSFEHEAGFATFCDSVFGVIKRDKIENLVVDIRDNAGGNHFHGDTLLTFISSQPFTQHHKAGVKLSKQVYPEIDTTIFKIYEKPVNRLVKNSLRFNGKVFLITNQNTFSSAALLAATFKCYKMGTIVGQETGGTEIFFDEPALFTLKNSRQSFLVSHQLRWSPCAFTNKRGTIPHYVTPFNVNDKVNKRDTELEFIRQLLTKTADI